jgi:hypothetical protein
MTCSVVPLLGGVTPIIPTILTGGSLRCGISIRPKSALGQSRRIRTFAMLLACPLCLQ